MRRRPNRILVSDQAEHNYLRLGGRLLGAFIARWAPLGGHPWNFEALIRAPHVDPYLPPADGAESLLGIAFTFLFQSEPQRDCHEIHFLRRAVLHLVYNDAEQYGWH